MKNEILGVSFNNFSNEQFIELLTEEIQANKKFRIALSNPEFLLEARRKPDLLKYLNSIEFNVADGMGVVYASKLLNIVPIKERITGTDLLPALIQKSKDHNFTFYFLGGKPGVAEKATRYFSEKFKYEGVIGYHHGYFDLDMEPKIIEEINNLNPDILMVCLGNPRQENWIQRNFEKLNANLIFGNGGALDFYSERVKRAPLWIQKNGLEWLFRLSQDFTWQRLKRQVKLIQFPFLVFLQYGKQRFKKSDNS